MCVCRLALPPDPTHAPHRVAGPPVTSPDIQRVTLHSPIATRWHLYATPFAVLYPLLAYAYFVAYDRWIRSEEWTFVYTVGLISAHALSFLVTRWSIGARAAITCTSVSAAVAQRQERLLTRRRPALSPMRPSCASTRAPTRARASWPRSTA